MRIDKAVSKVSDYLRENRNKPEFCTLTQIRRGCNLGYRQTKSIINILLATGTVNCQKSGNKITVVLSNP